MSLYPCSACHDRVPGKLSQVYWAWVRADGTRRALRQRLCLTCFCSSVLPLVTAAQEALVACPVCHASTVTDMDPVYATVYMPGQERIDSEMALCGPCAVEVRNRAQEGGEDLPDRQGVSGGLQPPDYSPAAAWASLGLDPRARSGGRS